MNFDAGDTRPNELVAKLSSTGSICIYTLTDDHFVVDVEGYVPDVVGYTALVPQRFADSRDNATLDGRFRNDGPRAGGTTWEIPRGSSRERTLDPISSSTHERTIRAVQRVTRPTRFLAVGWQVVSGETSRSPRRLASEALSASARFVRRHPDVMSVVAGKPG